MPDRRPELLAPILAEASGSTAQLRIYGPIDAEGAPFGVSAAEFGDVLANLPEGTDTIDLHIHSRGGDVFDALAIVQQLRDHPATVKATVDSLAASSASAIAVACDTLAMAPDSSLMIHDARTIVIASLTAGEAEMLRTRLAHASDTIANIYARKAGGSVAEWRAAMDPEQWYNADEAVKAGLADSKLSARPAGAQIAASLDLSIFAHAGRDHAPPPFMPNTTCRCGPNGASADPGSQHKDECPTQAPAADADGSNTHERSAAVAFTDEQLTTMRQQLGLPDDADEAAIVAAQTEALAERADPPAADPPAPAPAARVPEGSVLVPQAYLDTLKEGAEAGKAALARQQREDRDKAIAQAQADGKLGRAKAEVDKWSATWDRDPEGTAKWIADLPVRFPVGAVQGYQGEDGSLGDSARMSQEEQDVLDTLTGAKVGG